MAPLDPLQLPDFPVRNFIPAIRQALADHGSLILSAATGAGKSTLVPPALEDLPCLEGGRVLVLQPQRLGTRAIAERIGAILGRPFGEGLGTITSAGVAGSPKARIQVMTYGVFLRIIQDDPELAGVGCVVLDEFHTRTWQGDLCLSFLRDTSTILRPALRLVVMSATLDAKGLQDLMPGTPFLEVPGRLFPVETRHVPPPGGKDWWKDARGFLSWTAGVIRDHAGAGKPNVLCFLPGMAEIRSAGAFLASGGNTDFRVHELHSSTPDADQARALSAPEQGQVFLASNIAETGLTLPGIGLVVDTGLTRLGFFEPRLDMEGLRTLRPGLDACTQRQGRAGRTGPGTCLRLWDAGEVMAESREPDIRRCDLSSFLLEAVLWGAGSREDLHLAGEPSTALWNHGVEELSFLGITDGGESGDGNYMDVPAGEAGAPRPRGEGLLAPGKPGPHGADLARSGLPPALARGVYDAFARDGAGGLVALALAVWLEHRGRMPGGPGTEGAEDAGLVIAALFSRPSRGELQDKYRKAWARFTLRPADRAPLPPDPATVAFGSICQALRPLWTGRLREFSPGKALYLLASGRQALLRLPPDRSPPEWLVALECDSGDRVSRIRHWTALPGNWEQEAPVPPRTVPRVEWQDLQPKAFRCRMYGSIELSRSPLSLTGDDLSDQAVAVVRRDFARRLEREGSDILPWTPASTQFMTRLELAWDAGLLPLPEGCPGAVEDADAGRKATPGTGGAPRSRLGPGGRDRILARLLPDHVTPRSGRAVVDAPGLMAFLQGLVDYRQSRELDRIAPAFLALPGGRTRPVDYSGLREGRQASVSLRIQDAYALAPHPVVLDQPLVIHLLSPAGRPVQTTSDLAGFWEGSWKDVRKDMKGRYPKHDWPEHPGRT